MSTLAILVDIELNEVGHYIIEQTVPIIRRPRAVRSTSNIDRRLSHPTIVVDTFELIGGHMPSFDEMVNGRRGEVRNVGLYRLAPASGRARS